MAPRRDYPQRFFWGLIGAVLFAFVLVSAATDGEAVTVVICLFAITGCVWMVYSGWRISEARPRRG